MLAVTFSLLLSAVTPPPRPPNWQPGYKGWQNTRPGQPGVAPQPPLQPWQQRRQWQESQGWQDQVKGFREREARLPPPARLGESVPMDPTAPDALAPHKRPPPAAMPEGAVRHQHHAGDYISKDGVCYRRSWMTTDYAPIPCPDP